MNFGNLQRKLSVKEFEIPLLRIPQNVKTKNYKRLVFEKEKGPVVQGLSCNFRGNIWYAYRNYFKRVHCKSNIPAVVIMFVQRINIPGYNVYTDLNQKNLFRTVDSYFMIL